MSGEKTITAAGSPQAEAKGRSTWSWVLEFAGMRKGAYVASVALVTAPVRALDVVEWTREAY
jgi:hypothetical protein